MNGLKLGRQVFFHIPSLVALLQSYIVQKMTLWLGLYRSYIHCYDMYSPSAIWLGSISLKSHIHFSDDNGNSF